MNIFKWFTDYPNKIGFEDIKNIITNNKTILINTLPSNDQSCLIQSTILCDNEEKIINELMKKKDYIDTYLIIYGKNASDNTPYDKYSQLKSIGFSNIYIYSGGLFEWLLLQDIYGSSEFPTTKQQLDILKYKEPKLLF
tara:strand:+ start:1287 stop:1703 length:417 start_codon:yes stop_codon:yes gene_type:complete